MFENRLNFSFAEGLMVGGPQPELKYLNPLMILHNYMDWSNASSILSIELSANPWKYFQLYGQYIFNRVPDSYEQKVYGEHDNPYGRGYLAGVESRLPWGPGYLGLVGEFYYTDPYMYVRENALVSYAWHRRVVSNVLGSGKSAVISTPLGYRYGSDAMNLYGLVEYAVADQWSAGLSVNAAAIGENGIDSPFAQGAVAVKKHTPSGTAEYVLQIGMDLAWRPLDWLSVGGGMDWYRVQNADHEFGKVRLDLQPRLDLECNLGRKPIDQR